MKDLLRIAYRGMVRLYPASFRSEFGEEMLWIYDEEASKGRSASLFLDAACAIVRQRVRPRTKVTVPVAYYVEVESALPAQRIAQGMMVAIYLGFCFFILLAPWVSLMKPSSHGVWFLTHIQTEVPDTPVAPRLPRKM